MPQSEMTREDLVALFAMKATAPPPETNKLLVRHLQCKESIRLAGAVRQAMDRVPGTDSMPLSPPSELLPPSDNNPRACFWLGSPRPRHCSNGIQPRSQRGTALRSGRRSREGGVGLAGNVATMRGKCSRLRATQHHERDWRPARRYCGPAGRNGLADLSKL